jgi:hypothetical protein
MGSDSVGHHGFSVDADWLATRVYLVLVWPFDQPKETGARLEGFVRVLGVHCASHRWETGTGH